MRSILGLFERLGMTGEMKSQSLHNDGGKIMDPLDLFLAHSAAWIMGIFRIVQM